MTTELPPTADAFVRSINDHNPATFIALFDEGAVVNDAGREIRGLAAIKAWGDHDIFAPRVTLEVIRIAHRDQETIVTTLVDGNFDRTGLPDPVIIDQHMTTQGGKITHLTCRLADAAQRTG